MRKRYQKDSLAHMKHSGEIHEQLVTYDEEGGGEMDTNGYAWIQSEMCYQTADKLWIGVMIYIFHQI